MAWVQCLGCGVEGFWVSLRMSDLSTAWYLPGHWPPPTQTCSDTSELSGEHDADPGWDPDTLSLPLSWKQDCLSWGRNTGIAALNWGPLLPENGSKSGLGEGRAGAERVGVAGVLGKMAGIPAPFLGRSLRKNRFFSSLFSETEGPRRWW